MKAKISTISLVLFMMFWAPQVSVAQIITTLPNVSGCPGTQITVPVTVDNFADVASLSITFNIDPSVINLATSGSNFVYTTNPALAGGFLVVNSPPPYTKVQAAWFALTPVSLTNGSTLFTFTFNYLGGSCPLTWDVLTSGNCTYSDILGTPLAADWVNGSVTGTSPVFDIQPADVNITEGSSATFNITATGADTYQWQESNSGGESWSDITDGTNYAGATTTSLTINSATIGMNGYQYRCGATGTTCNTTVYSNVATLAVSSTTTNIINQIGNVIACQGTNVLVPVTVANFDNVGTMNLSIFYTGGLTYVGLVNTNPALGSAAINASAAGGMLSINWTSTTPATIGTGTLFDIEFEYTGGNSSVVFNGELCNYYDVNSNFLPSTFVDGSVMPAAVVPSITANPTVQTVNEGQDATFQITATGADAYQWQVGSSETGPWVDIPNGTPYSGATSNTLTITATPLTFSGQYYRCVASEGTCSMNSASGAALLTVLPITTDIITTIGNVTTCPGGYVTIPVNVTNFNDVASASMKINYDTLSLTYDSVNNVHPSLSSGVSVFNAINGQVGMAWFAIVPATFGSGLLYNIVFTYNANSSPLTFDLSLGTCQYTDMNFVELPSIWVNGSVNIPSPVINNMPVDQTAFIGTNAVFTLSGTLIDTYQWQRKIGADWVDLTDGIDYSGVNTASLTVANCTLAMDGYLFRCAVTGTCGTQYSHTVSLMVINANPVVATLPTITQCQGNVTVPVNVTDFNDVGSFKLTFKTTGNTLSYNGYQGANSALVGMTITHVGDTVTVAWTGTSAVTLGSATLVTIKYNSIPGTTPLSFVGSQSYFKSLSNTILPKTLNSGNVTINAFPGAPSAIQGPATVCQGSGTTSFSTTGALNADSYVWGIIPSGNVAGEIVGTGLTAVVTWNPTYIGTVTITVKGQNSCGVGGTMSKFVTLVATPVVTFDPLTALCSADDTTTLTGGLPAGGTYSGSGVVNNQFIPSMVGPGTYTITYTVTVAGCSGSATQNLLVKPSPVVALAMTNPTNVCYYHPAFNLAGGTPLGGTYSGPGVTSNNGVFTPTFALIGDRTITYSYSLNGCSSSATGIIHVDNCIGIPENNALSISVLPNPTTGAFQIKIQNVNEAFELGLYNDLGQKIFNETITPQNNEFNKNVDLSNQPKGLYFLKLYGKESVKIEKIVLN